MKRMLFLSILLVTILFHSAIPVSALEMSVGATTWYAWWKQVDNNNDMNLDPAFLYGPMFSVRIDDSWSVSGVFLYGDFKSSEPGADGPPDEISRTDSDLAINYNLNRYFKVFLGGKYMGFSWDEGNGNGKHWSAGPGAGIGCTLPLGDFLYLLANFSGTYSYGKHKQTEESYGEYTINLKESTANTNVTLVYYIKSVSTSINLGFRYQYLHINYDNNSENASDESHYFYGGTLAAVYSFSI